MNQRYFASIAVISPSTGLPHVTTVWAYYENEKFYVITNKKTAKYRFIKQGSNKVGLNIIHPSGYPFLSVNGHARLIFESDKEDFWEIILQIIKKYNKGPAIDQWLTKMKKAGNRMLIEINPDNLFSPI